MAAVPPLRLSTATTGRSRCDRCRGEGWITFRGDPASRLGDVGDADDVPTPRSRVRKPPGRSPGPRPRPPQWARQAGAIFGELAHRTHRRLHDACELFRRGRAALAGEEHCSRDRRDRAVVRLGAVRVDLVDRLDVCLQRVRNGVERALHRRYIRRVRFAPRPIARSSRARPRKSGLQGRAVTCDGVPISPSHSDCPTVRGRRRGRVRTWPFSRAHLPTHRGKRWRHSRTRRRARRVAGYRGPPSPRACGAVDNHHSLIELDCRWRHRSSGPRRVTPFPSISHSTRGGRRPVSTGPPDSWGIP